MHLADADAASTTRKRNGLQGPFLRFCGVRRREREGVRRLTAPAMMAIRRGKPPSGISQPRVIVGALRTGLRRDCCAKRSGGSVVCCVRRTLVLAHTRGKVPPFMLRRVVWFVVVISLISIVGTVVMLSLQRRLPLWAQLAITLVPVLATLPITFGFVRWSRGVGRRAFECRGRMCWDCGYVLTGLANSGACPECGKAYSLEGLQAKWRTTRLGPLVSDDADMPVASGVVPPGERPKSAMQRTPRFVRRRLIGFVVGMCLLPAAVMVTTFIGIFGKAGVWYPVLVCALVVVSSGSIGSFVWLNRGLVKRLRASGNRLCFSCGYDVSTLPEHGSCPECGEPFEHEELRTSWLDFNYAARERWPPRAVGRGRDDPTRV